VRLFVAAYPPPEVRDDLAGLVDRLTVGQPRGPGRSVRLARPEDWHITLAFLGDVPESKVDAVRLAMDRAMTGGQASTLRVAGGGTFGRGQFTVLWVGLRGDVDDLTETAAVLRRALRAARLPFDNKRFRPHLTIARPGDRINSEELACDLAALEAYESPPWIVDSVWLMRSHLGPHPSYDIMHEVALTS
jgi:RNA 2',3'-cyclic 3'-phosphodiesterase